MGDLEMVDKYLLDCATYEDYLDRQVQEEDLMFLDDPDHARTIVALGYKGKDFKSPEEFEAAKRAAQEGPMRRKKAHETIWSAGKSLEHSPFLYALAKREELVRSGKLSTIIFIRDTIKGHEVSGYIDYGHRLKSEGDDFEDYFRGRRRLLPKRSDLSFYSWRTHTLYYNNSATFHVIAENDTGLLFKHKRDRKTINVDPNAVAPGDNSSRTVLDTNGEYTQVTFYDHVTRRKN